MARMSPSALGAVLDAVKTLAREKRLRLRYGLFQNVPRLRRVSHRYVQFLFAEAKNRSRCYGRLGQKCEHDTAISTLYDGLTRE